MGDHFTAPAGLPAFSGVVEYRTEDPYDALVRIDKPGPGVAALGIAGYPGGPMSVSMHFYLYGDTGAATLAHEAPLWEAWFERSFPAAAE